MFDDTANEINGLNLYMYCGNNPVMKYDPTGQGFWGDLWDKTTKAIGDNWGLITTVLIIGASVALIATGIGAPAGTMLLTGAGIGGLIGVGTSIISQGIINGWSNINFETVAVDGLFGMASGAIAFSGLSFAGSIVANFAIGASGSIVGDLMKNNDINWRRALVMGGASASLAAIGPTTTKPSLITQTGIFRFIVQKLS